MYAAIKSILCMIIAGLMQTTAIGTVEVAPETAAQEFLSGLAAGDEQVVVQYLDNEYVNMLENSGDEEASGKLYESLFRNFSYDIVDTATKNDVAVARVEISNCDFSQVLEGYEEASYRYVTGNLYEEDTRDKEKLAEKCLEIYLDEIEGASESDKREKATIYLPMRSNGAYGWEVLLDETVMEKILGGLQIPEK